MCDIFAMERTRVISDAEVADAYARGIGIRLLSSSSERAKILSEAGFRDVAVHPVRDVESGQDFLVKCNPSEFVRDTCLRKVDAALRDQYVSDSLGDVSSDSFFIVADTICFVGKSCCGTVVGKCRSDDEFDEAFAIYRGVPSVFAMTYQVEFGILRGERFEHRACGIGSVKFGGCLSEGFVSAYRDSMFWKGRAGGIECARFMKSGFETDGHPEVIRGLVPDWKGGAFGSAVLF